MKNNRVDSDALAEVAKEACIQAALMGYENASISGLCREGAWEAAISAIRMLDLGSELKSMLSADNQQPDSELLS